MSPNNATTPEQRLAGLNLELPAPPSAVANYIGAVQVEALFVSGHSPVREGEHCFIGKLGRDMDVDEGRQAAQLVALNMLATMKAHLGELARVKRCVKLLCMVNSTPDFKEHALVANGASDLFVEVFGQADGKQTRSAVGFASLPLGIAVEIEGTFEIHAT